MASRLKKWLRYRRDKAIARVKRLLPEPARRRFRQLQGMRNEIVSRAFSSAQLSTPEVRDEYHRLVAANVAGVLLKIMNRFYGDLGVDAHSVPVVKALESFRRELPMDNLAAHRGQAEPVLVQFERAFALFEAGRVGDALPLFEAVFRNSTARKLASYDPYLKEAVVRSGEVLGRHHEKRGDVDTAIIVYREILSIDQGGTIARRLILLLSRRGDLREAAEFAENAAMSKLNLFPRLPENNPYIAVLQRELLGK